MRQHDLRYLKPLTETHTPRNVTPRSITNLQTTVPIVQYADYHNQANIYCALDIDTEQGLIAAGMDRSEGNEQAIGLWSIDTGDRLEGGGGLGEVKIGTGENARCVNWVKDDRGKERSLWAMTPELQWWRWSAQDDVPVGRREWVI